MGIKRLAEAVIAQAMNDLSDDAERNDCIRFFKGEGFRICAETANIGMPDQIALLNMVNNIACEARRQKALNADVKRICRKNSKCLHAIRDGIMTAK